MSAPKVSDWRLAARLLPYMRPHAGLFAVAVLLAPASAAMANAKVGFEAVGEGCIDRRYRGLTEPFQLVEGVLRHGRLRWLDLAR